jgi:hypothetical protein
VTWRVSTGAIFFAHIESGQHDDVSSLDDAEGGLPALVPLDRWVTLAFVHDGVEEMELYIDGARIARRGEITRGVPSVRPRGIRIGNSFHGDAPLRGQLDEIKVWRLDPNERERQFLARPVDEATARCIEAYTLAIHHALREDPKCLALRGELEEWLRSKLRIINGAGLKKRLLDLRERYDKLWRAGNINGPEMQTLFRELHGHMRALGIDLESDQRLRELVESECFQKLQKAVGGLECDPCYTAFMEAAVKALFDVEKRS